MCYLDVISSWSTNEITVNWNSALSWVASFVADQGAGAPVQVAPAVTQQPASVTAAYGSTASFTAAASGTPAPTVQWQIQQSGPWHDIAGATATTLDVVVKAGARYRAVFTNAAGSATTTAATLTVAKSAPVITKQPVSVRTPLGKTVTFTAAATGYPTPTVTWQVRWFGGPWVTVPGAKSTTLTFKATVVSFGTEYRAVFTNAAGTTATNPASLTLTLPGHHGPRKPGKHSQRRTGTRRAPRWRAPGARGGRLVRRALDRTRGTDDEEQVCRSGGSCPTCPRTSVRRW